MTYDTRRVLKVSIGYAIVGSLWVFFSNLLISTFLESEAQISLVQALKGWFYVAGTALVLAFWYSRLLNRKTRLKLALTETQNESESQAHQHKKTAQLLETILDRVPAMISLVDARGRLLWVNQCWERTFGWMRNELDSIDLLSELYPDPAYRLVIQKFSQEAQGEWREVRPCNRAGRRLIVEYMNLELEDGTNLGIGRDITERKRGRTLRDQLFNHSLDLMVVIGFEDRLHESNPAWEKVLGWERDDLAEKSWLSLVHPEDLSRTRESMRDLRLGMPVVRLENRYRHKNGSYRTIVWNSFPLIDEKLIVGVGRDISELKHQEALHRQIFEGSLDMVCIVGMDGYFRELNPAWESVLGWTHRELLSQPWIHVFHPGDHQPISREYDRLKAGAPLSHFECRARCKDGSIRVIALTAFSLVPEELIFLVARDLTQEKELESELFQAQKMESLAQLAGSVAHDFNNLLAAIMAHAQLADLNASKGNSIHGSLEEITAVAGRAARLIDRLMVFGRKQQVVTDSCEVNQVIEELAPLIRSLVQETIRLEIDLSPEVRSVRIDRTQLEQVLMNLCVNAKDAMPAGGRLNVSTRLRPEPCAKGGSLAGGQGFVELTVSDTGCGIPEEFEEKIFEPFFTTKEEGKGTGLGLATVYGIVRSAAGEIHVDSRVGDGTTFVIRLPECNGEKSQVERCNQGLTAGTETILLVEDDLLLRRAVSRLASSLGYKILEAGSGEEALEIAKSHTGPIDLMLSDVMMPGLTGPVLAERFVEIFPSGKVILMTGYAEETLANMLTRRQRRQLLRKPFDQATLAESLRAELDST